MRVGLGLCLLLSSGCASAPSEGPAASAAEARGSIAAEEASPDRDGADPPAVPGRPLLRARTGNPWIDCYRTFQPSDDPAVDLAHLTSACAARAGMSAVTPVHIGTQGQDDPPERLAFRAHRKRCYRAFAVGAPSVIDLDVAIFDPQGVLVTGDISRDRWPVVPPRGPLCAPKGGRYTIEIGVAQGSGEYVFQVWGSQEDEDGEDQDDRAE